MFVLLCLLCCLNAQYYNIESDTLFSIENMANDIPYANIHSYNANTVAKTNAFYQTLRNGSSHSFTDIQCHHYKDFYYLLYTMCQRSILCAEMYYLETDTTIATTVNKVNFKKFVYQLALSQLFIIQSHRPSLLTENVPITTSQLFMLEDNVPIEWIPRYIIHLDETSPNEPCHLSMDLSAQENIPFIHSTLYLLHAYKYYVVNDYKCDPINQWLVLDAHNKGVCYCKHGKSCDTESNYRIVIGILSTIMTMMIIFWIISFFVGVPRLIKKMDEMNNNK